MGVVYKATSRTSGKSYVGMTTKTLDERKQSHLYQSRYTNPKRRFPIHNAIRKYGWDDFAWEELFSSSNKDDLIKMEIYFIGKFNTYEDGYNMTLGGEGLEGSNQHRTITEETAKEIISMLYANELRLTEIAEKVGVSKSLVSHICNGASWAHLYDVPPKEVRKRHTPKGENNSKAKLNYKQVSEIKSLLANGKKRSEIMKIFNVSYTTVSDIDRGLKWSHVEVL